MSRRRSSGSRFPWSKLFLSIFIIVCAIAIVWTGYLFYTQQLNKIITIIILASAIAVLIWASFLIRRYRMGPGVVFAVFIVTALICSTILAFSSIEPFTSAKNEVMNWTRSLRADLPANLNETMTSSALIHGQVIIADKLQALSPIPVPPNPNNDDQVFWIVKVTFKNLSYNAPIIVQWDKCYSGWVIISGEEVYRPNCVGSITSDKTFSVEPGQDGEFSFNIIVPRNLTISEAKICYQGQEPFSYGTLSGGDTVIAYDWETKSVITHPLDDFVVGGKKMLLRTIDNWSGSETTHIRFEANKSPWVVNWEYKRVSEIGSEFGIFVITEAAYEKYDVEAIPAAGIFAAFAGLVWAPDEYGSIVVPQAGNFVIVVNASGVNWQLKVGVE
jgi:hypothetical protein